MVLDGVAPIMTCNPSRPVLSAAAGGSGAVSEPDAPGGQGSAGRLLLQRPHLRLRPRRLLQDGLQTVH